MSPQLKETMERSGAGDFSAHEQKRIQVIEDAVGGRVTVREAARLLQLSPRQIKRLKQKCRAGDTEWMRHGNRGRPKPWRTPDNVRSRILEIWASNYSGLNDSQLWRALTENEGISISRETVRRILRQAGHTSPRGPGRPRREPSGPQQISSNG
jgi:transposase